MRLHATTCDYMQPHAFSMHSALSTHAEPQHLPTVSLPNPFASLSLTLVPLPVKPARCCHVTIGRGLLMLHYICCPRTAHVSLRASARYTIACLSAHQRLASTGSTGSSGSRVAHPASKAAGPKRGRLAGKGQGSNHCLLEICAGPQRRETCLAKAHRRTHAGARTAPR